MASHGMKNFPPNHENLMTHPEKYKKELENTNPFYVALAAHQMFLAAEKITEIISRAKKEKDERVFHLWFGRLKALILLQPQYAIIVWTAVAGTDGDIAIKLHAAPEEEEPDIGNYLTNCMKAAELTETDDES